MKDTPQRTGFSSRFSVDLSAALPILTLCDSAFVRGLAVFAMIFHHVFAFSERWPSSFLLVSVLPVRISGVSAEEVLAKAMSVCVSMFLFVTGYGLMATARKSDPWRSSFARLSGFLSRYWLVLVIYVPVGIFLTNLYGLQGESGFSNYFHSEVRFEADFGDLLSTAFGLSERYNSEWWFVKIYLFCILCFPILLKHVFLKPKILPNLLVAYVFFLAVYWCGEWCKSDLLQAIGSWAYPFLAGAGLFACQSKREAPVTHSSTSVLKICLFLGFCFYPFARLLFAKFLSAHGVPPP